MMVDGGAKASEMVVVVDQAARVVVAVVSTDLAVWLSQMFPLRRHFISSRWAKGEGGPGHL
jgi:hypothetical protein